MKTHKEKILVNGSVVLDTILEREFFGGTGANIAYGLGKFKTSPMLFSLAGQDFKKDFELHLKKSGVDLRVYIEKKGETARFFSEINTKGRQVCVWQSNIYKNINKIPLTKKIKANELKKVSVAIFSPGTPESIIKHLREFRNYAPNALVIFDPGQEISNFSKKRLGKCINLCDIFIVNETEYAQAKKILGKDPKKSIKKKIIIETKGSKGSVVFDGHAEGRTDKKTIKVPAVRPKRIFDLTGAGDAYRTGLIFGLWKGISLGKACALGARLAAKNIECLGCQRYKI